MIDSVMIPEERLELFRDNLSAFNRKLRNFFDVKMLASDVVEIEGDNGLEVMRTKEIVTAFGRGFEFEDAMNLVDEDYILEIINAGEFSGKSRNRMRELKGRVIGYEGKSKEAIEKYSGAKVAVYGKTVSIVGKWGSAQLAKKAVVMLLNGAKHTTVFRFLEDNRVL